LRFVILAIVPHNCLKNQTGDHGGGTVMKRSVLEKMPIDELWELHEEVATALAAKMTAEKEVLEYRLSQLLRQFDGGQKRETSERRPYPAVTPKFRNPDQPSETWAGRGKQPRWLTALLKSGKRIDEFRIASSAA
jgi:DNA-binding protein H-NS